MGCHLDQASNGRQGIHGKGHDWALCLCLLGLQAQGHHPLMGRGVSDCCQCLAPGGVCEGGHNELVAADSTLDHDRQLTNGSNPMALQACQSVLVTHPHYQSHWSKISPVFSTSGCEQDMHEWVLNCHAGCSAGSGQDFSADANLGLHLSD
jgi:hypothetical protein